MFEENEKQEKRISKKKQSENTVNHPVVPPLNSKGNRRYNLRRGVFARTIMSFLLIATGAAIVWLWMQERDIELQLSNAQAQLERAQTEKSLLNRQIKEIKSGNPEGLAALKQESEQQAVTEAARAFVLADAQVANDNGYSYTIVKQNEAYARVLVGIPGGNGYSMILKNANDQWVVVYVGQDTVPAATVEKYAIPSEYQQ